MTLPLTIRDVELESLQLDLLEVIAAPLFELGADDWPLWDWVARRFDRHQVDKGDWPVPAGEVLNSLPSVRGTSGTAYGLVWSSLFAPEPTANDAVGLTVAGLWRLSERRLAVSAIADGFARLFASLGESELRADFPPNVAARVEVHKLRTEVDAFLSPEAGMPKLSMPAVGQVVRHEHAVVGVQETSEIMIFTPSSLTRRYRAVASATDYREHPGRWLPIRRRPA